MFPYFFGGEGVGDLSGELRRAEFLRVELHGADAARSTPGSVRGVIPAGGIAFEGSLRDFGIREGQRGSEADSGAGHVLEDVCGRGTL